MLQTTRNIIILHVNGNKKKSAISMTTLKLHCFETVILVIPVELHSALEGF